MTVVASGTLCWRTASGEPQVLVIHRSGRNDLSFPKGKTDPGEMPPTTAVRETLEETGLKTPLGPYLGEVHYQLPSGADKVVYYWSAKVSNSVARKTLENFTPNSEVDKLFWLDFNEAKRRLSYPHDVAVLERLGELMAQGIADTFPVIVQRHGKAMSRSEWGKSERTRPLTEKGKSQAKALSHLLAAWNPATLLSSPWERCLTTLKPYAEHHTKNVDERMKLSERGYLESPDETVALVEKHVKRAKPVLFCSHRPVLPGIMSAIVNLADGKQTSAAMAASELEPGSFAVVQMAHTETDGFRIATVEKYRPLAD